MVFTAKHRFYIKMVPDHTADISYWFATFFATDVIILIYESLNPVKKIKTIKHVQCG